jgi:hypothetical protein
VTPYRWAILLSGLSAVLGLGREVVIVARLGLGSTNDLLQFILSITYTVALLGEPLRSASLNLLGRRTGTSLIGFLALIIGAAAIIVTLLYARHGPDVPWTWVVAGGVAGAANLVVAWVLPRSLRAGPFLPVHAVSVMPNILIVAGVLIPASSDTAFAGRVVMLFLAAPLVQLVLFRFLFKPGSRDAEEPEATARDARVTMGWHGASACGAMGTQYAIRAALATAVPGTLSAFVLALRAIETVRAVFIDTYVASRLRKWTEDLAPSPRETARRMLPRPLGLLMVAAGLAIAVWWPGTRGTLLDPSAIVLLAGLYPMLVYRVFWQALNTNARPVHATARVAAVELAVFLLVSAGALIPALPMALLPWLAYVVRPVGGLAVSLSTGIPPENL